MFAPHLQSVRLLQAAAHRLSGIKGDFDSLIDLTGDAVFVLLGEASHGTHEFYSTRTEITRRLIKEKGFQAVAVEAAYSRLLATKRREIGLSTGVCRRMAANKSQRRILPFASP